MRRAVCKTTRHHQCHHLEKVHQRRLVGVNPVKVAGSGAVASAADEVRVMEVKVDLASEDKAGQVVVSASA